MNVKSMIVGFLNAVVASTGTYFLVPPPGGVYAGDQMYRHQAKGKRMYHRDMMMLERLNEADSDGDGKVTKAEIKTKQEANLAKYDTNNDGQLSLEEYKPLWIKRHNRRIVRSFQFLDANGNGQVSDTEYKRVIDWIVARMDRNEDGVLSKRELKPHHRKGSKRD